MSQNSGSSGVSRRKIVMQQQQQQQTVKRTTASLDEEPDSWTDSDVLFVHHLREILDKWSKIDDEIWGKIICMQKNRRVAKAYARSPLLTLDGSDNGFDGLRIGLAGFENPKRFPETEEVIKQIGQGVKIKMENDGSIYVKRLTEVPVIIRSTGDLNSTDHCLPAQLAQANGEIKQNEAAKVFDMKRFTHNIATQIRDNTLDRQKLELQCIVNVCFGSTMRDQLSEPCWVMVINVVALDMLRNKLPEDVYAMPKLRATRMPKLMENISEARLLSTPRDEHYPRLGMGRAKKANSVMDMTMVDDYPADYDPRYSQPIYNIPGGTYGHPAYLQVPPVYPAQFRQPLQNYLAAQRQFAENDYAKWQSQTNLHMLYAGQVPAERLAEWEWVRLLASIPPSWEHVLFATENVL